MDFEIIPDSELSVDALINSEKMLFTESEMQFFEKTPWTKFKITGITPEKNNLLYVDMGQNAYSTIITLDNTLKNALNVKSSTDISFTDIVNLDSKITLLNSMASMLNLPSDELSVDGNMISTIYAVKNKGFLVADVCLNRINEPPYSFRAKPKEETVAEFHELAKYVSFLYPVLAVLRGSYIDYVKSNGHSHHPKDIDVDIVIENLTEEKYAHLIQLQKEINGIEVRPNIIPFPNIAAYTFFNTSITKNSIFLTGEETACVPPNRQSLIDSCCSSALVKTREYAANKDKLKMLCETFFPHNKINSIIRKPERIYLRFAENEIPYSVAPPAELSRQFEDTLPLPEIQKLIAHSSTEVSRIISELNKTYL